MEDPAHSKQYVLNQAQDRQNSEKWTVSEDHFSSRYSSKEHTLSWTQFHEITRIIYRGTRMLLYEGNNHPPGTATFQKTFKWFIAVISMFESFHFLTFLNYFITMLQSLLNEQKNVSLYNQMMSEHLMSKHQTQNVGSPSSSSSGLISH